MGVIGLWNILSPAANEISLHKLAITEGFMANSGGVRVLRVGVDASGWIFRASYRHGHTKNPELATLFVWCTRLFQLPIAPLFIFDGAGRPKTKRGKQVRGNHHWITHSMKEMLDGFGFAWADAPGEAEAELAWLNKSQIIDAVLTEDSDAIIFGATTVLRTPSAERGEDFVVVVYRAHDIRTHPKIQLELPDLLLVVLLVGGDYSSGLHGCGISTALGLAHAGYGCTLVHGINSNAQQGKLVAFLALWREGIICELRTNRSRLLPKCRPLLAQSIPSDFPDIELIQLYLNPITSEFRQSKEPSLSYPRMALMWSVSLASLRTTSCGGTSAESSTTDTLLEMQRENMASQRETAREQLLLEKQKILLKEFECKIWSPRSYHRRLAVLEGRSNKESDDDEPSPKRQNTGRYSPEWDMSNFDFSGGSDD